MKNLLRAETYRLFHDRVFWAILVGIIAFYMMLLSGSAIFSLPGQKALSEIMKKEIIAVLISCLYGGPFLGGGFADRTLYHGLLTGKSRGTVLCTQFIVFSIAAEVLLYCFPLLLVVTCTVRNGWGAAVSAGLAGHLVGAAAAFLILGVAIGAVSLLASVCFRDVGRTIGIPIVLYFGMILLLNSPDASTFMRIFPVGILILVTEGTVSPAYGALLGGIWSGLLFAVSALVFRRAELR